MKFRILFLIVFFAIVFVNDSKGLPCEWKRIKIGNIELKDLPCEQNHFRNGNLQYFNVTREVEDDKEILTIRMLWDQGPDPRNPRIILYNSQGEKILRGDIYAANISIRLVEVQGSHRTITIAPFDSAIPGGFKVGNFDTYFNQVFAGDLIFDADSFFLHIIEPLLFSSLGDTCEGELFLEYNGELKIEAPNVVLDENNSVEIDALISEISTLFRLDFCQGKVWPIKGTFTAENINLQALGEYNTYDNNDSLELGYHSLRIERLEIGVDTVETRDSLFAHFSIDSVSGNLKYVDYHQDVSLLIEPVEQFSIENIGGEVYDLFGEVDVTNGKLREMQLAGNVAHINYTDANGGGFRFEDGAISLSVHEYSDSSSNTDFELTNVSLDYNTGQGIFRTNGQIDFLRLHYEKEGEEGNGNGTMRLSNVSLTGEFPIGIFDVNESSNPGVRSASISDDCDEQLILRLHVNNIDQINMDISITDDDFDAEGSMSSISGTLRNRNEYSCTYKLEFSFTEIRIILVEETVRTVKKVCKWLGPLDELCEETVEITTRLVEVVKEIFHLFNPLVTVHIDNVNTDFEVRNLDFAYGQTTENEFKFCSHQFEISPLGQFGLRVDFTPAPGSLVPANVISKYMQLVNELKDFNAVDSFITNFILHALSLTDLFDRFITEEECED